MYYQYSNCTLNNQEMCVKIKDFCHSHDLNGKEISPKYNRFRIFVELIQVHPSLVVYVKVQLLTTYITFCTHVILMDLFPVFALRS